MLVMRMKLGHRARTYIPSRFACAIIMLENSIAHMNRGYGGKWMAAALVDAYDACGYHFIV